MNNHTENLAGAGQERPASRVIVRKATYQYDSLKPLIFEIMDALGGESVKNCKRVLIKPNLLTTAKPDDAVLTHFNVVRAVAEYILEKGAIPQVSDSPALGAFDKILRESGIRNALRGLNVECVAFRDSLPIDVGAPFGVIDLARDAIEAEMIINLPKLKTHDQMLLTLGVKNMFGCVVGMRKPEWHMRMGANRDMFARLLVRIYERLNPFITILDGILAMEGEGPGKRGKPRRLDILLAGRDAFSVDRAVCRMLGLQPDSLPTLKTAREMSLHEEALDIDGILPTISNFRIPSLLPLISAPPLMHGFIRRYLLQRPVCDPHLCRLCGKCGGFCPAGAINHSTECLSFDYNRCIRCYCCIEVCPYGALHAVEPAPGRMLRKLVSSRLSVLV